MVPPPKTHTFWQFTAICGILLFFPMFKCVCIFWRLFYIFKKLCRVVKTLPLIKLFSFNRMIFTKPRETQKTKKPKLFRECLVWGSCLFFLVFLEFFLFFFGHDLEKTKKIQGFFGFLDKLMVKELWKTQKNLKPKKFRFFLFFLGIVVTCLLKICPKTKKTWVFLVFCLTSSKSSFKKTKKTLSSFSFFKVMTKKIRGKPKKNKHEPQTKHSLKSFGFLVFSKFPRICPAIYFRLLSLKTGLVQREVAFFLWRLDFFKKRSSLQGRIFNMNKQSFRKTGLFQKRKRELYEQN